MTQSNISFFLGVMIMLGISIPAVAHRPVVIDGGPTTYESAYDIGDPGVSQVGYHRANLSQPVLWFTFEAVAEMQLYLELGVPKITGLEELRPHMALVGPGLPANPDFPFAIPENYGVLIFDTANETPEEFHEHFTGTRSWKFNPERPIVPETGQYYMAGYLPDGTEGKFWMAIGTREEFSLMDIISLPRIVVEVRRFHEVFVIGGLAMGVFIALLFLLWGGFMAFMK